MEKEKDLTKLSVNYSYCNSDLNLSETDFFKYVENKIYEAIDTLGEILGASNESIVSFKDYAHSNIECESTDPLVFYFDDYFWSDFCLRVGLVHYKINSEISPLLEWCLTDRYFRDNNVLIFEKFKQNNCVLESL